MMAISLIALILSIPFTYTLLRIFSSGIYIYIYIIGRNTVRVIIGAIIWVTLTVMSMTFILIIDEKLDESERNCWVIIVGLAVAANLLIIQPIKCLLLYSCLMNSSPANNQVFALISGKS